MLADAKRSVARSSAMTRAIEDVGAHPARYAGAIAVALLTVPVAKLVVVGTIGRLLLFGFAGWAIEAIHSGAPRYSAALGGSRVGVPLLPVYAAGGLLVTTIAPPLAAVLPVGRGLVYATALSGLEWVACRIDRALGNRSWDYDADHAGTAAGVDRGLRPSGSGTDGHDGCVDASHAVAWGMLGRVVEHAVL